MKINFDNHSYIEILRQEDKIIVVIQAQDETDALKTITNACELTIDQFKQLSGDLKL